MIVISVPMILGAFAVGFVELKGSRFVQRSSLHVKDFACSPKLPKRQPQKIP